MALQHLSPGQPQALLPERPVPAEFESRALFKGQDLEVIRLLMPAGRHMLAHRVDGEITLQCLQGRVEVGSAELPSGQTRPTARLDAGELLFMQRGDPHELRAVLPSVVILTIALRAPIEEDNPH